jgi:hypothetical protein
MIVGCKSMGFSCHISSSNGSKLGAIPILSGNFF